MRTLPVFSRGRGKFFARLMLATLALGLPAVAAPTALSDVCPAVAPTVFSGSHPAAVPTAFPGFCPDDAKRAIPNNPAPPVRLALRHRLSPLPAAEAGTIRRVRTTQKCVALTFDLCELATSTSGYDAAIMDFLRREHIPATLFLGGKWMRTHAARTRQLLTDPLFELGSHAWTHGNFGIMPEPAMYEQVLWTQAQYELLREETARQSRKTGRQMVAPPALALFRLPYGRCSERALELLAEQGLRVIQWSVCGEHYASGAKVAARTRPGDILLFHANLVPKQSARLLIETVKELRRRGYRFLPVGALLRLGPAERTHDGYFVVPGDNRSLDRAFGAFGTAALPRAKTQ